MANNSTFELNRPPKAVSSMFDSTDPTQKYKGAQMYNLPLDKLIPFKSHPFKLYDGRQLEEMVESIKANGVIVPIIVRPADESTYEILSGHNRVNGAKVAELPSVPAVVLEGLTDADALLVVTETNLLQRSFADMSHSERALTLSIRHEAIKQQGKRASLIQEIETIVNSSNINDCKASSPVAKKPTSMDKVGQEYALSKDSVARYIRVNKLIEPLKIRLDKGKFGFRAAVEVSYLSNDEQHIVYDALESSSHKLDMKKAEALRAASKRKPLDYKMVEQILSGVRNPKPVKHSDFRLKSKIVSKYFKPEQKPDEIETIITAALDYYYAHQGQEGGEDS